MTRPATDKDWMEAYSPRAWIGVDLDGTLAEYDGWKSELHIGPPIAPMVNRVKRWLSEGWSVKIFTARVATNEGMNRSVDVKDIIKAIEDWSEEHIGVRLEVTNIKDYAMAELWDDRAVSVKANTGMPLAPSPRGLE